MQLFGMAMSSRAIIFATYWSILLSLYTCSESLTSVVYDHTVTVDNNNENATDSELCGSTALPCLTISYALRNRASNSTQIVARSGSNYVLNDSITIANINLIAVTTSNNGSSDITVTCVPGAGLSFVNCVDVRLQGLTLLNCSALQQSTSRNFSSAQFSLMKFPVALHFLFCKNVSLTTVRISNSCGTGLAMYATGGYNYLHDCTFSSNGSPHNDTFPSGGGVYIEFPFYNPLNSEDEGIPEVFFTNVEYEISLCRFQQNAGYMWHPIEYIYLVPQLTNHLSFGNGGGLSVFFSRANNSVVRVTNCVFQSNIAEWGGGMFVEFQEMSWKNKLIVESCKFRNNTAITNLSVSRTMGGGGVKIGYTFLNDSEMGYNSVAFSNCSFQNNMAFWGGGILFNAAREQRVKPTNTLEFNNCSWLHNLGRVGSALDLSVWAHFVSGASVTPKFTNCKFIQNDDIFTSPLISPLGQPIGVGTLYTQSMSLLFEDTVLFERNNRSAITANDASVEFMENCLANFTKNTGRSGGALCLSGSAFVRVHNRTNMTFIGNFASQFGGAIFYSALGQHELTLFGYCFIQYSDITLHPTNWTAGFFFENNTATFKDGGDAIYATSLMPCVWNYTTPHSKKLLPDPHKKVFCWNSYWNYSGSDCQKQVSSDPATFGDTSADSSRYHMQMILGKRQIMPIEVLGDKRNNQTQNAIFNVWSHSPDVAQIPSSYTYVSDNTIALHGTPNSTATLTVETINPRVIYSEVIVEILPCPPGFKPQNPSRNNTYCVCDDQYGHVIQCNQGDFLAKLQRGLWIGEDPVTRDIIVGIYPYTDRAMKATYIQLPNSTTALDELLCAPVNRTGAFCGECRHGYAPSINSKLLSCVRCTHAEIKYNWIFYILSDILPVTIFFFIIIFFHISVTRGAGNSFVFFAQLLTTTFDINADGTIPAHQATRTLQHVYIVVYGIWNLDFFSAVLPNFCIGQNLNTLTVMSLRYILAVYSLLLILIFYCVVKLYEHGVQPVFCLCKPAHRFLHFFQRRWNLNRSTIDAFSTFLVLSYTKFTVVSVYLLTPSTLLNSHGSIWGDQLYFQGNIRYLSSEHAPFFTMAMLVMGIFVLLPPLLLLVYPLKLVEKIMARLGHHGEFFKFRSRMHLFLDTFQGCFKDGTNGTRDCRYFAGLYFILRTVLFTTFAFSGIWFQQYIVQQLVCTIAILLFAIIRPYKKDFYNNLDAVMLGILSMINALSIYNIYYTNLGLPLSIWGLIVQYILIYCPLVYMICYILWKAMKRKKQTLLQCLRWCLSDRLRERTALLSDVLNESSEVVSIDDEYRHFADEVEAYGRDRQRNYYKPKTTESSGYGASSDGITTCGSSIQVINSTASAEPSDTSNSRVSKESGMEP